MFDHRTGPTPEETRIQQNVDALASFIRRLVFRCDKIRTTLKLGPQRMDPKQQEQGLDAYTHPYVAVSNPGVRGGSGYDGLVAGPAGHSRGRRQHASLLLHQGGASQFQCSKDRWGSHKL